MEELAETKERKRSGIYSITNNINKKEYIGKSLDLDKRLSQHRYYLKHNCHPNIILQRSWNKYGEENFCFVIIEECSIADLNSREIYYISKHNSFINGYNLTIGGDAANGSLIKNGRMQKSKRCLYCNKEIEKGYSRYCTSHKYKCNLCDNRIEEAGLCEPFHQSSMYTECDKCKSIYKRKANNQKLCPACYSLYRSNYQKELMQRKRLKIKNSNPF